MIIRRGEDLSPGLIESYLDRHRAVKECCVVGIDDTDLGEVPVAFVVARGAIRLKSAPNGNMRTTPFQGYMSLPIST